MNYDTTNILALVTVQSSEFHDPFEQILYSNDKTNTKHLPCYNILFRDQFLQ